MGEDKSLRLSMAKELRFIVNKEIWYKLKTFTDAHSYDSGRVREGALGTSL